MALPTPGFAIVDNRKVEVLSSDPDSGFVLSRSLISGDWQSRTLSLNWPLLSSTSKDQLLAEFEATRGGAGTLTFSTPTAMGAETLNCRFLSDTLELNRTGNKTWEASFELEVVRMVL